MLYYYYCVFQSVICPLGSTEPAPDRRKVFDLFLNKVNAMPRKINAEDDLCVC
jgi:hypothetical protein